MCVAGVTEVEKILNLLLLLLFQLKANKIEKH